MGSFIAVSGFRTTTMTELMELPKEVLQESGLTLMSRNASICSAAIQIKTGSPKFPCSSPACICGTAAIVDANVASIGARVDSGLMTYEGVYNQSGEYLPFAEYAALLFGPSADDIIHVSQWPHEFRMAYTCMLTEQRSVAMLYFSLFCKRQYNFTVKLSEWEQARAYKAVAVADSSFFENY